MLIILVIKWNIFAVFFYMLYPRQTGMRFKFLFCDTYPKRKFLFAFAYCLLSCLCIHMMNLCHSVNQLDGDWKKTSRCPNYIVKPFSHLPDLTVKIQLTEGSPSFLAWCLPNVQKSFFNFFFCFIKLIDTKMKYNLNTNKNV